MEIEITRFFTDNQCPRDYSARIAELGEDASKITWQHAREDAADYEFLDTPEKLAAFADYAESAGMELSEDEKSPEFLNALFLQWIAGDCREMGLERPEDFENIDWQEIDKMQKAGSVPSNIFPGRTGKVYFYCGV